MTPLGLARVIEHDDEYRGYRIPKGATASPRPFLIGRGAYSIQIIPNVWSILHDEERYPDPMAFKPERFLGDEPQQEPNLLVFGFGKRICPGRFLADKVSVDFVTIEKHT